ncbi:MAG TPA: TonB-dependent receptor, partial [Saprospiraceae bacterium]|nr:TonB-dependent receptor [Saprospiraceae bacterium]
REGSQVFSNNEKNSTYTSIEPRLGLIYTVNNNASIKTGITRNFQYLNLISNTVAATPIDFWKSTDLNFKPMRSDNIYLGYYMDFLNKQYEFSSEVYYSKLVNTQEYKDFADLLGNEFLETEILFGRGKNYGLELSFKKVGGKVTGNASYTLSRSLRQMDDPNREMINFGNWYPSIVDKPHNFNMLINFNVTKRMSFNFNFAYLSGRPLTVPVNKYEELNVGNVLYFGERNTYRMPDYHRLDFSLNLLPSYNVKQKVKQSWNFTVLNLYARKNPYSVFFRQNRQEPLYAYKYSILGTMLPSLSLNLEIK